MQETTLYGIDEEPRNLILPENALTIMEMRLLKNIRLKIYNNILSILSRGLLKLENQLANPFESYNQVFGILQFLKISKNTLLHLLNLFKRFVFFFFIFILFKRWKWVFFFPSSQYNIFMHTYRIIHTASHAKTTDFIASEFDSE